MRRLLWVLVLVCGCAACPERPVVPPPTPDRRSTKRPKDRIGDIMNLKKVGTIPTWLIKSYAEWVNFGYAREDPRRK